LFGIESLPNFAMQLKKQNMPTIFIISGLRFMFFANDHEPIHIHAVKGDAEAKFSVMPEIKMIYK